MADFCVFGRHAGGGDTAAKSDGLIPARQYEKQSWFVKTHPVRVDITSFQAAQLPTGGANEHASFLRQPPVNTPHTTTFTIFNSKIQAE